MLKVGVAILRYLPRIFGICALLVGVASGLLEVLKAQFVCVDSCPQSEYIFPDYLSNALMNMLLPTTTLLVMAYLAFAGYCLATAQAQRLRAPTLALVLGAAVSVGAIAWYSHLFITMIPVGKNGTLIHGSAETWIAGLGQLTAGLTFFWASFLTYLQWSPERKRQQLSPDATPSNG